VYYAQKNIFLTVNTQKISIFLTSYFCVYFSERSPSEKYFSDGIRIFLCVFARTEECEFPVVDGGGPGGAASALLACCCFRLVSHQSARGALGLGYAWCRVSSPWSLAAVPWST